MAVLELKQVKKTFGSGHKQVEAMKVTNFSADRGELIAIIGPSGSGKSTFLTIVGGLLTPTSGEVIINDKNLADLNEKERSKIRLKEIGFILQASNLNSIFNGCQSVEIIGPSKEREYDKKTA